MEFISFVFNRFGLIIVFIFIMLEYACFPLPSEVILPFIGYLANVNFYNLFGVIMMSVIMGYMGCLVCYLFGYYGGSKIYNKIYNKFPSWRKGLDVSYNFFYKYGNLSVMLGRVIPMCRTYVSFFAGMFKQSLFKYSFYSIFGVLVWNIVLISLGYVFASNLMIVENFYKKYKLFFVVFIILLVMFFLFYKMYKKKKKSKTINGD